MRTHLLKGTGLGGGKESQVTRRNQSRRDGTICSPARECRVGFHANRVPKGRHNGVLMQTLKPCIAEKFTARLNPCPSYKAFFFSLKRSNLGCGFFDHSLLLNP